MSMSWDEYKKLKQQEFGIEEVVVLPITPKRQTISEKLPVRLYNVHKRTLPKGIDKVVVLNVDKNEAERWAYKTLKPKVLTDKNDVETVVYCDPVPTDAKDEERSIYYRNIPIVKETNDEPLEPNMKTLDDIRLSWVD